MRCEPARDPRHDNQRIAIKMAGRDPSGVPNATVGQWTWCFGPPPVINQLNYF